MSASGRDEGPTTQTLDSDEMPPPMPSSWRPYGSGLPIAARKISSHAARSRGRSFALKTIALLVPPRMKTAGILSCFIGSSSWDGSILPARHHEVLAPELFDPGDAEQRHYAVDFAPEYLQRPQYAGLARDRCAIKRRAAGEDHARPERKRLDD